MKPSTGSSPTFHTGPWPAARFADGTSKPISEVALGDDVLATDPETGESGGRKVVGLIVGDGYKQLVHITVTDRTEIADAKNGDANNQPTGTVVATDEHPFWVPELARWIPAKELKPGMWLRTSTSTRIQITAVQAITKPRRVHNLTVADLHTYHVLAGETPVLVHNCGTTSADVLKDPKALDGLTPSQVDDLAKNAGCEVMPGKVGATNPATRYYLPGTNRSQGFRVLPQGVPGQAGSRVDRI